MTENSHSKSAMDKSGLADPPERPCIGISVFSAAVQMYVM